MQALALLLALLGCLVAPSLGLFADQAGLNDWTKQHVGEVVAAVALQDRVLVATQKGVVASLLRESGEIGWRRVLPKGEDVDVLILDGDVLISKGSRSVYAWALDGQLLWDFAAEDIRDVKILDSESLAVLTSSKVVGLNKRSGAGLSKITRQVPSSVASKIVVHAGSPAVVLSVERESSLDVVIDHPTSFARNLTVSKPDFAVTKSGWLFTFKPSEDLVLIATELKSGKSYEVQLGATGTLTTSDDESFVIINSAESKTTAIPVDGSAPLSHTFPESNSVILKNQGPLSLWAFDGEKGLALEQKGQEIVKHQLPREGGPITRAWFFAPTQVLVVRSDSSLSLLTVAGTQMNAIWTRDEALADVVKVISLTFPKKASILPTQNRLLAQVAYLNALVRSFATASVTMGQGIVDAGLRVLKGGEFELKSVLASSEEERARFGFNRILIFLTKKNKLFAIHSETAETLWKKQLDGYTKPVISVAHEGDPEPRAIIMDSLSGRGMVISGVTGETLSSSKALCAGHKVIQYISVDAVGEDKLSTLLLLCENLKVVEYPYPAAPRSSPVFVHVLQHETNEFSGYRIDPGQSNAEIVWSINFPSDSRLVSFASPHDHHDAISSPVRSLGDGSLLIKYVDPHVVAVTTIDPNSGLRVHLINTVTGKLIHRISHRDGTEPVHSVRFENWFVYSFWNSKAQRTELVSLTLYEKTPVSKRQLNPWTAVPQVLNSNFSSFDSSDISVIQRSFSMQGQEVTSLGVTTTRRGIAAKNLLMSLGGTGQVLMMDQRLIDPRRTTQAPTEEEKVEGLFQYSPELPIVPTSVLSYYRGAGEHGAHLFYVAPTLLESTCTVIACGLDIFKGRASPSGTFDLLAEDFNYMLLVLLITSLAVCVYVLRSMERRKSLDAAWA